MAKQNAKPLQVLIGRVVQNLGVDGVLTECRLILFEAKAPQPTPMSMLPVVRPPVAGP